MTVKGPSPQTEQRGYISYLLRLWTTERRGKLLWRASLESARTGQRRGFAGLEDLFAFLQEQTGSPPAPAEGRARVEEGGDDPNARHIA
ncbi:MAG: hypothetical protein KGY78_07450 [Anaerolineae bacterium]|nr:hypothetical protein [Anaerolineae bacterium]